MEEFVAKILKIILFVLVGAAPLLGGFSGGICCGTYVPVYRLTLGPVRRSTVSPDNAVGHSQDLQTLFKPLGNWRYPYRFMLTSRWMIPS